VAAAATACPCNDGSAMDLTGSRGQTDRRTERERERERAAIQLSLASIETDRRASRDSISDAIDCARAREAPLKHRTRFHSWHWAAVALSQSTTGIHHRSTADCYTVVSPHSTRFTSSTTVTLIYRRPVLRYWILKSQTDSYVDAHITPCSTRVRR